MKGAVEHVRKSQGWVVMELQRGRGRGGRVVKKGDTSLVRVILIKEGEK